jgi:hypothetical protein
MGLWIEGSKQPILKVDCIALAMLRHIQLLQITLTANTPKEIISVVKCNIDRHITCKA